MNQIISLLFILLFSFFINGQKLEKTASLPLNLEEASGMTFIKNIGLFILEDSKKPFIYKVDEKTGKILQVLKIENAKFKDKESLTADENYLYVGDIGDNEGKRKYLQIIKIPISQLRSELDTIILNGEQLKIYFDKKEKYTKKKDNVYDFEAMIAHQDSIFLFSKQRKDKRSRCFVVANNQKEQRANYLFTIKADGLITGATLSLDKKNLILIGYQRKKRLPFILSIDNWRNASMHEQNTKRTLLSHKDIAFQLEAITYITNTTLLLANEWTKHEPQGIFKLEITD